MRLGDLRQDRRREEVALLAGVSPDFYVKLERGNLSGVSDGVLDAVARALQLDDAERTHLFDLARTANASPSTRRKPTAQKARPGVQRVLDAMGTAPAWIRNGRADVLATNTLGRALYAPVFDSASQPPNTARFFFLDPRAEEFYIDGGRNANDMVAVLRAEALRGVRASVRTWAHDARLHRRTRVGDAGRARPACQLGCHP